MTPKMSLSHQQQQNTIYIKLFHSAKHKSNLTKWIIK